MLIDFLGPPPPILIPTIAILQARGSASSDIILDGVGKRFGQHEISI